MESKSRFFSAGVRVWSPKFCNPGVGVGVPQKKQGLHITAQEYNKDNRGIRDLQCIVPDHVLVTLRV